MLGLGNGLGLGLFFGLGHALSSITFNFSRDAKANNDDMLGQRGGAPYHSYSRAEPLGRPGFLEHGWQRER